MDPSIRRYRMAVVLLAAALVAALTTALTRGPAVAVDGPVDVVYVADGTNFPDALAGATLAGAVGAPLLIVAPNLPLPADTTAALAGLDPDRIVIFGGPLAVSNGVQSALVPYTSSGSVTRIYGTSRYGTAAAIADALPDKVHEADLLDGYEGRRLLTHWVHWVNNDLRSHSPGLEGVTIDRPSGNPVGVYCIHLPSGVSQSEAAVGSIQSTGPSYVYDIAVTTTRGHACNTTGPWEIAVDITDDGGVRRDSDFTVMFSASVKVYP